MVCGMVENLVLPQTWLSSVLKALFSRERYLQRWSGEPDGMTNLVLPKLTRA